MISFLPALILFLFPLAYSPGPGNLFFAANGARFGFRATLPANMGYHLATWPVTVAVGFGLLSILQQVPALFQALQLAGAGYVFWIAYRLFHSGDVEGVEAQPAGMQDGVILLLLNPKAYVIMGLMYSQFLMPEDAQIGDVLLIASIFTVNNMLAFCLWTLAGERIGHWLGPKGNARTLNRVFGLILGGVAIWMLLI